MVYSICLAEAAAGPAHVRLQQQPRQLGEQRQRRQPRAQPAARRAAPYAALEHGRFSDRDFPRCVRSFEANDIGIPSGFVEIHPSSRGTRIPELGLGEGCVHGPGARRWPCRQVQWRPPPGPARLTRSACASMQRCMHASIRLHPCMNA